MEIFIIPERNIKNVHYNKVGISPGQHQTVSQPYPILLTYSVNDPTSNFFSRISGRLRVEIIVHPVYDDRPAQYLIHPEPVRHKRKECPAARTKQRWHIPCVIWVGTTVRVIVTPCVCKTVLPVPRAFPAVMDVECEDRPTAWLLSCRQPLDLHRNHDTAAKLIKLHDPCDIRVSATSLDAGFCIRPSLKNRTIIHKLPQSYICFII